MLNDRALERTWYSTLFTRNNYKSILEQYNYEIPKINLEEVKKIINSTLKDFPILMKEEGFNEVVFKIIS